MIDVLHPYDRPADAADLLGGAIHTANRTLREAITADPALAGMGTTLVALTWSGTTAVVANVGWGLLAQEGAERLMDEGRMEH
ncbi:hypothetical protein ACFYY8_11130 [Streptosporangium sp. NPDC001559]|uniref:hypothetical protein n=1 Tax=Streptosporangium sp. NPDC001559 TaxID=3366187 RepID=UPI0036E34998